jgi:hypothetical protein
MLAELRSLAECLDADLAAAATEAAAKFGVDRSTVTHICRVAKQGALLAASVPSKP